MDDDADDDRRRQPRYPLGKKARARMDGTGFDGTVRDISATGAGVDIDGTLDEDLPVHLDIEDFGHFPGTVARSMDDFIGVEFDLGEDEELELIANIRRVSGDDEDGF